MVPEKGMLAQPEHAARDAAQILERAWADADGKLAIPVDVVRIARTLGVQVFDADLGQDVSGAIVKKPGSDPTILLNDSDSINRKRFSCAHEIGHFVVREGAQDYEHVDGRSPLASQGIDSSEVYANKFAASLLMPEAEVKRRYNKNSPVVALAVAFLVSEDAMRFRLESLGVLPSTPTPPSYRVVSSE